MNKIGTSAQVVVTLGPATYDAEMLKKIDARDINFVRINLSHTRLEDLDELILKIRTAINTPLILDTEGSQVRTGAMKKASTELARGSSLRFCRQSIEGDEHTITLRPEPVIENLAVGDLIYVDHDAVIVRVDCIKNAQTEGYVECSVMNAGKIGANKAVAIQFQNFSLPALSEKDQAALELSKRYSINTFTLSFIDSKRDVLEARAILPHATLISKIETRLGVENIDEILEVSDGILIDRGDLSREIPAQKIPLVQKFLIQKARTAGVPVYVATNFLDTMMKSLRPSRAEVNDIVNTLLDGATGLVLAAETAIGKYPLETINLLQNLCREVAPYRATSGEKISGHEKMLASFGDARQIAHETVESLLIHPHGNLPIQEQVRNSILSNTELNDYYAINISFEDAMDVEQIAVGTYNPLRGFMSSDDYHGVLSGCRLTSGVVWPIPLSLHVDKGDFNAVSVGDTVLMVQAGSNRQVGLLHVEDKFTVDLNTVCTFLYGTNDKQHPGVATLSERSPFLLGGRIELLERYQHPLKSYELTPLQARTIFESRGWARVVGFHSRNPVHRGHEYIQRAALERGRCDGLFLHPVIGKKKTGDFVSLAIVKSYEAMLETVYKSENVAFGTFATYSRYAGPREALFTALCRQNFGCSHIVIGRDHAGVGSYYGPRESQQIFEAYSDVGITPVCFDSISYCTACDDYIEGTRCVHGGQHNKSISGTEVRSLFRQGSTPPTWFMRSEVSKAILSAKEEHGSLYVEMDESTPRGKVLWLTGLSGSGKSTIAGELYKRLNEKGLRVKILDGDEIRATQNTHLGFTPDDILENNRLIAELAQKEGAQFDYVLVPVIAPFEKGREKVKEVLSENVTQIFVATSLEECMSRDPKGLYQRARNGEIQNFIGIDLPYETPRNPDFTIVTEGRTVADTVTDLIEKLEIV